MRTPSVAVLATLVAAVAASPAGAAITSSNITAPADGTHYLVTDADLTATVTVSGTSNGTTGDHVAIRCYERADRADSNSATNNVAVAANGTFSVQMRTDLPYGSCILRAVPAGFSNTADASAFTGPAVVGEETRSYKISGGPNDGKVYDFYASFAQANALTDYSSAFTGGLYDARLQYAPGSSSTYLWWGNGGLESDDNLSTNDRSSLQVDGLNAYGPSDAENMNSQMFVNTEGFPQLSYDVTRDPATDNATIHETDPVVVCPANDYPPATTSCAKFIASGVQLERTITTDDGGQQTHIADTWRSVDNNPHTISAHYSEYVWSYDTSGQGSTNVGVKLPWLGDFATFSTDTTFPGPGPGAGSLFVRTKNDAPDGSTDYPVGALSFDVAPNDVRRFANDQFHMRYENFTVPAGGTVVLREDFAMGTALADVQTKAAAAVDRLSPPVLAITTPANGASIKGATSSAQQTVAGTASDNAGIASLTLNGAPVTVAGDGSFSAPATLALGSNTLTAVATDHAGNTTTATTSVTYADNVAPTITGFMAKPSTFAAGPKATAITAKAKRGTTFNLKLSEDATVAIAIKQCRNRTCKKLKSRGTLHRTLKGGARSVKFSGRIGKRKLAAGRYIASVVATDASKNKSKKKTVRLRVVG